MSVFREYSIKQRLFVNGFALVIAMGLMLFILFYQGSQMSSLARTQQLIEQINTDVLIFRRHEKDFLMRTDVKYQQRLNDHAKLMEQRAAELAKLLEKHVIDVQPLTGFMSLTQQYETAFNQLVQLQTQIGLNAESGLMGELRTAVRALESRIDAQNNAQWSVLILQLRRAEKDFLLRKDNSYAEQFDKLIVPLNAALQGDSQSQALANVYQQRFKQVVELANTIGLDETQGVMAEMRGAIHKTESSLKALSEHVNTAIEKEVKFTETLAISVFVGVLAIVLLLVALTSRSILQPILQVCTTIGLIREQNDFRMRVDVSGKDEMTMLGKDFNAMLGEFQDLIKTVNQALEMLDTATNELARSTADTSRGMQQQQVESDMVATAVTEMGATINEIASNTEMTAAKAEATNQNSQTGRKEVQQTVSRIQSLSERLQGATAVVSELEKDSKTIGSVLDVIRGIAEQTNLLALNAAIEAARAGEQGRGFAVVADEVRNLAMRTQESTRQIETIVGGLQGRTNEIVKVMLGCTEQGSESAQQANVAMHLLTEITQDVTNIMDMTTQIAAAIEEQSHVAAEVNKNVVRIRDLSEETYGHAQHNASISEEVTQQAARLHQTVDRFRA